MGDYKRELAGRKSKATGQLFEKMIEDACSFYRHEGIASIEKTPEPVKCLQMQDNGRFVGCFTKSAQPDFKGVLCDGTCITFDAKHTDTDRISQSAVLEQQADFFDTYEKLGAHCFVLVSIGFRDFFRVPWTDWKRMKELFGHKHMTREEMQGYKIPSRLRIAFLEGVELREHDRDEKGEQV